MAVGGDYGEAPTEEPRYIVIESERAGAERERAFFRLLRRLGPAFAGRWQDDLLNRIQDIAGFPGPLALAVDEEASQVFQCEVRRELYYGPGRRRTSGLTYRILFTVKPPFDAGEPHTILILRVLHGAQSLTGSDAADDSDP